MKPSPLFPVLRERFRSWTGNLLSITSSGAAIEAVTELAARRRMQPQAYIDRIDGRPEERAELIERLLVRTTWFMREPDAILGLTGAFRRRAAASGRNRFTLWSVACSTGEEPYTLAMSMLDAGLEPTILATDLSEEARETAALGEYHEGKIADLPLRWQKRYFTREQTTKVKVAPHLRSAVSFVEHNLSNATRPPQGWANFDAIICRNVLLYFERPEATRILRELADNCREDGYMLLSAAEHPIAWSIDSLVWDRTDDVPILRRRGAGDGPAPTAPGERLLTPIAAMPAITGNPSARPTPPEVTVPPAPGPSSGAPLRPARSPLSVDTTAELTEANAAARRGDPDRALAILNRLITRDPLLAPAHLALGLVQKTLGKVADATAALRRARFLFGDDSWLAPYTLAVCLEMRCDWREALEAYRHAAAVLQWGGPSGLAISEGNEDMLASTVLESCRQRIESLRRL
jgi:chemotaxis methyl-accepting protein methylase